MPQILNEEIVDIGEIAPGIYKIVISSEYIVKNAKPGQFVNIKCAKGLDAYLRRPISICDVNESENTVTIIFQVRGKGTKLLAMKKTGERLDIIAPLGWGSFSLKANRRVLIIGGGIGVFPLYELSKRLKPMCEERVVVLGFRNEEAVVMKPEFEAVSERLVITTDDGSLGIKGYTTDILVEEIVKDKVDMIYACGPMPMLAKIAKIAKENDIECEVSLEERMGCGIGACLVCACKTKHGDEWEHSHVCYNGPVFNAGEVVF